MALSASGLATWRGLQGKEKRLLDAYLDGAVPVEVYQARAAELAASRRALELRLTEAEKQEIEPIAQLREVALTAAEARIRFQAAADTDKREVLQTVLCNLVVEEGRIASYQWKDPFGLLEMESSGAFKNRWWAIVEALRTEDSVR